MPELPKKLFVGVQNDVTYLIDAPPRPAPVDHMVYDGPGLTVYAKIENVPGQYEFAEALADAYNKSRRTCDVCGQPADMHTVRDGGDSSVDPPIVPGKVFIDGLGIVLCSEVALKPFSVWTPAESDVLDERAKQRTKWGNSHDNSHDDGALATAAAWMAHPDPPDAPDGDLRWWHELRRRHHENRRRQLVIAAALCIAEIERLDRDKQ